MTSLWNEVRTIINKYGTSKDLLLSLIDKEGNIFSINQEMRKVLDIVNQEKDKINLFDYVQQDHVDILKTSVRLSGETRNFYPAQLSVKNGHYHHLQLKIHPLPNAASEKQLFLCIGNEMNEANVLPSYTNPISFKPSPIVNKAGTSVYLPENEKLFNEAMDNMPALTWMIDEKEKLVFANKAYRQYFRLPDEAINNDIRTFMPKKVIDSLYQKHVDALTANLPVLSIEKIQLADGTDISFQISLFPVQAGNGGKIITGQAFLLPDKCAIEKKLQEAHEQLLLVSQATKDAIWEWDMRDGRIFRNEALMNMIGFRADDTNGLAWWFRRIHPEDRNRVGDKVKEVTDNGLSTWEDKYRFKCAGGDYKDIHDRGYIMYENGLPVKMICALHDVSEIKALQDQLDKEKLERQKELSETVLQVQEKERARIGYELHDNINQILTTVKLLVDMLEINEPAQYKLKEKSQSYLLMAIEEIRRLSKGLVVPQLKENGLVDSIQTMIDDINISNAIKIKFNHDFDCDLLSPGKKFTLFRIVQEQLKNILTYSKAEAAQIHLHLKEDIVSLIITDNGVGFDSRQTSRGIGLSNIFERSRYYNGQAIIASSPGNGCTLTINMPFAS